LKWIGLAVAGLVAVILVLVAGLIGWSAFSVEPPAGEARVPGLVAPVEIVRDDHGVPHIAASSPRDAYFALGYAHAQDRLFQMQLSRRVGQGRLAEWVGRPALGADRFMRTLGLARLAENEAEAAPPALHEALAAYAAGVNSYIAGHRGPWPPEFTLLFIEPEPWRPADSILVGKLLALMLTGNWGREATRARFVERFGADEAEILLPSNLDGKPTVAADAEAAPAVDRLLAALPPFLDARGASNIWAMAGTRTASGSPILANDPHLGLQAPSLWYLARLNAPGLQVTGATVPGIPFTLLGHNARVAWGFTTTNGDASDLFIEKVDPNDPGAYLTPDGPRPFETRVETIRVRFGAPEKVTIRATRHGPVVSETGFGPRMAAPQGTVLALAHAALAAGDTTPAAIQALAYAKDAAAFREALKGMHAPMQNVAFADMDGRIGLVAAGRLPVRKSGDGRMPAPGWDGSHDWTGWVPFDDLPQVMDPPSGLIWNANNAVVPRDYRVLVGTDFDVPYRADRIEALLAATPRHDLMSSARMQADVHSPMADDLLPRMLARLPSNLSGQAADARRRLAAWNHEMAEGAVEPLLFTAWLREADRALFAERLGADFPAYWGLNPETLRTVLDRAPCFCTAAGGSGEDPCAPLLARALDAALADLTNRFGSDMGSWTWGKAHVALLDHPMARRVPLLGDRLGLRAPTAGGDDTLLRGAMRIGDNEAPFANVHGAGFRAVYDLRDLDRSLFVISTGQSGNVWSAAFRDLLPIWREDGHFEIPATPAAPRGAWRLTPAG
jgi:penicillin amidase